MGSANRRGRGRAFSDEYGNMIRVAMIEDDPVTSERIISLVSQADDIEIVGHAASAAAAREMIKAGGFDVLLCDIGLPDGNGIHLMKQAMVKNPDVDILVVTIFANQSKVLDSIKAGARGYLLKDDGLENCVNSIREIHRGGSPISPMIARQLLRQLGGRHPQSNEEGQTPLSEREVDVLNMLARGFAYAEIGDLLGLSTQTVATYVKRLYRKLEVNSRSEAVFEAQSRGIINVG